LAATEARDGDRDLLEFEPLELDRELELEDEREPEPLESEAESLDRDFRRFFLVLLLCEAVGPRSNWDAWPFNGLPRASTFSLPP
jgi:hypothetical protein